MGLMCLSSMVRQMSAVCTLARKHGVTISAGVGACIVGWLGFAQESQYK